MCRVNQSWIKPHKLFGSSFSIYLHWCQAYEESGSYYTHYHSHWDLLSWLKLWVRNKKKKRGGEFNPTTTNSQLPLIAFALHILSQPLSEPQPP